MTTELAEFPHLAREETYGRLQQKYLLTSNYLQSFATRLKDCSLLVSTFGIVSKHTWIGKNLPTLSNFLFKSEMLHETLQYVEKIRIEWQTLLSAFRDFMSNHLDFKSVVLDMLKISRSKLLS